eukprot:GSChrysophyteH1.ASY1.ANO1.565.1 assembled CDS
MDVVLSLDTYGRLKEAQEMLLKLIESNTSAGATASTAMDVDGSETDINTSAMTTGSSSLSLLTDNLKMGVLESRWIEAARELGDWDALNQVGSALHHPDILLEVAIHKFDWTSVRNFRSTGENSSKGENATMANKLCDIMLSVLDSKHTEADRLCMQSVQVALMKWQGMGIPASGSVFHKNMVHNFHRIIELRESANIVMEISKSHSSLKSVNSDFDRLFDTWKARLPLNTFDGYYYATESDSTTSIHPKSAAEITYPGISNYRQLLKWRAFIMKNSNKVGLEALPPQRNSQNKTALQLLTEVEHPIWTLYKSISNRDSVAAVESTANADGVSESIFNLEYDRA